MHLNNYWTHFWNLFTNLFLLVCLLRCTAFSLILDFIGGVVYCFLDFFLLYQFFCLFINIFLQKQSAFTPTSPHFPSLNPNSSFPRMFVQYKVSIFKNLFAAFSPGCLSVLLSHLLSTVRILSVVFLALSVAPLVLPIFVDYLLIIFFLTAAAF